MLVREQSLHTSMPIGKFTDYVKLIQLCIYHETWSSEYIWTVLEFLDCPKEWREPVRLVAEGWSYYSADTWYAKYVDPSQRSDYMDEYWDMV
jgi:hypothetical protein